MALWKMVSMSCRSVVSEKSIFDRSCACCSHSRLEKEKTMTGW